MRYPQLVVLLATHNAYAQNAQPPAPKPDDAQSGVRPREVAYLAREHIRPEIRQFADECGVVFRGLPKELLSRQVDNRSLAILTAMPLQNFTLANYFARDFATE